MSGTGSRRPWRLTLYLLALNLLLLAAGSAWQRLSATRDAVLPERHAERIGLWSPQVVAAAAPLVAQTAPPVAQAAPPVRPATALCLEIVRPGQVRYREMAALLDAAGMAAGACSYRFDRSPGWWVFWPPEADVARRAEVRQAIEAAGVVNFLAVEQGPATGAFLFGLHAGEAQAARQRDTLRRKGLEQAEYGPRPVVTTAWLGCAAADAARLADLRARLPGWARPVDEALCQAPD